MRIFLLLVGLCLATAPAALAAPPADVVQSPACHHCGMNRGTFSHSRMLIEYEDGSRVATCSLHCTSVELANTIDRMPVMVSVADYDSKELIDAEKAVWVIGGSKKGVMTGHAKWAFASREAAERFVKANGGTIASFDAAIKAAYDDMYQDTKMIREFRKMKRLKQQEGAAHH
ncbi:nitrous oxide reductase accessory protein NosL [Geomobilimonas luticola]|uniref:Nitrous oxide reductase accessory protein NosL n=1 Tax=Geomobilimonas luticola TaxID=1114878 RepID=A0ABS5SBQ1_9BACT|nr:nitrous oxide reductase accessory protein NosL [Geomobilimonas luticola]MBT0652052.1 nitrous oxide reductase accessory protein NosL [Geomobilimonas luticola]